MGNELEQDLVSTLQQVSLFSSLGRAELRSIASRAVERTCTEGEQVCAEGEQGDEFFIIREGTVRVEQRKSPLRDMGPGEFFGELALLDRGPRSATVTALTDVKLAVVLEQDFTLLIDEIPAVAHILLAHLAGLLRQAPLAVHK